MTKRTSPDLLRDALQPIQAELQKLYRQGQKSVLLACHQMGQVILAHQDELKYALQLAVTRRTNLYDMLAESCGGCSRTLRAYVRFATIYEEEDIPRLMEAGLTWSHVRLILSIDQGKNRTELEQVVQQQKLTATELAKLLLARYGNRRPRSGRRPRPPANLQKGLLQLTESAGKFQSKLDLLFGEEFDLPTVLEMELPEGLTQETRDQMAWAVEMLQSLANRAAENAETLSSSLTVLENLLAARQQTKSSPAAGKPRRTLSSHPDIWGTIRASGESPAP